MERERVPLITVQCNAHGFVGLAHSLDEAVQMSSDHKYEHPACENYLDDAGKVQKFVHIVDTAGNVWS